MKLTDEQKRAVVFDGHAVITACPGSGKTRTIIAKILKCIDSIEGTPRKVACITYTNTAVHEIERRIRTSGTNLDADSYEVSTIHAFCLTNIIGKYFWLSEGYENGYEVLPSDSDIYTEIANSIGDRFDLDDFTRSQFDSLNRQPDGTPQSNSIPNDAALAFWDCLKQRGFIDFCNIVYQSYLILLTNPSIAHNVSCRFAYLLVDEFQDTSALQVEILKLIHGQSNTVFFLVGDPEQSIFGFAGAERELMNSFATEIGATSFPITGNFRATEPLVAASEALIPRDSPMVSVSSSAVLDPSVAYLHAKNSFTAITDNFLPFLASNSISYGDAAILAQNWFALQPLGKQLREYGVPVVGPGARPYKRKYLLGRIAEQVCAYIDNRSPETLHQAAKELFAISVELTGRQSFHYFSYSGSIVVQRLIRAGLEATNGVHGAVEWLNRVAIAFEEILVEENVIPSAHIGCFQESKEKMITEMASQGIDLDNMELHELGMLADPRQSMKLMTMHSAKGREFEAVAIICAHDGVVPYHNYYNPLTDASLAESRRLFYVAMTRAERSLWIFSSNNKRGLPKSRFLTEIGY